MLVAGSTFDVPRTPRHRQRNEARPREGQGNRNNAATYWHGRRSATQRIRKLLGEVPSEAIGDDGTHSTTHEK